MSFVPLPVSEVSVDFLVLDLKANLSPKGEFLNELTEGSHLFACSLFLGLLISLVLETYFRFFSFKG